MAKNVNKAEEMVELVQEYKAELVRTLGEKKARKRQVTLLERGWVMITGDTGTLRVQRRRLAAMTQQLKLRPTFKAATNCSGEPRVIIDRLRDKMRKARTDEEILLAFCVADNVVREYLATYPHLRDDFNDMLHGIYPPLESASSFYEPNPQIAELLSLRLAKSWGVIENGED